jgi:excinuclease ABC subunit C
VLYIGSSVLVDGSPAPSHYRWYRIRSPAVRLGRSDDCASLAEMIAARFAAAGADGADGGGEGEMDGKLEGRVAQARRKRLPDLLLIDGGKGQVCAGREGR